jgi:predicted Zn-dependent protease
MNNPKRGKGITRGLPHPAYFWAPVATVSGILVLGYYSFLDEAPFTKRKRLIATSPAWERRMGDEEYKRVLRQYKGKNLPPDHRACITVKRVGSRIAQAANKFASENIAPEVIQGGSPYTYTVVRSDMANAFVLPNNHIFVFTGLFKYARDEDQLAAVLGHEVAHNLARHAGEKISGSILVQIMARVMLVIDPSGVLYSLFLPAATLLHDLPHSRDAEIEADHIGIHLAAGACYDPRAAKLVFA